MSSSWVPEEERTPAWWVFHKHFMVRIPYLQLRSIEDIQHFGMPTTGIAEYDQATANELIMRPMTIAEMVEHFGRGTNVRVVNYNDTKEIYELIKAHLDQWQHVINTQFHHKDAPVEELALMAKFADAVYVHAEKLFDTNWSPSAFARRMQGTIKVTRDSILPVPPGVRVIRADGSSTLEADKELPANEMAAVFASRQVAGKAKWK